MGNNILDNVFKVSLPGLEGLLVLLKIPFIILLAVCIFYSFMLILKIRILRDTIDLEGSNKVKAFVYINLLISLIAGILGIIIVVLG
jgi:hypothetical protein